MTHVWGLVQLPITTQINQLLQDKQFELALRLAVSDLAMEQPVESSNFKEKIFN